MAYDFSSFKKASEETQEWLRKEFANLRTGRATPGILDAVSVSVYGSQMPINQLATINIEGPKSLRIIPWDKEVAKAIDSAIRESNLGLSVSLDDQGLRVNFPELTSERRTLLLKVAKENLEEARIRIRNERQKTLSDIDSKEDAGEISEDEQNRYRNELQRQVDEANKQLEALYEKKEKEITE